MGIHVMHRVRRVVRPLPCIRRGPPRNRHPCGTLSYPEIAGGEFAGVDIISGEIYGGDIKSGKLKWSAIFNGSISPEVEQDNCTRDDKPDPWQPATAGEWRFWFNDDNLLAEWFKKI